MPAFKKLVISPTAITIRNNPVPKIPRTGLFQWEQWEQFMCSIYEHMNTCEHSIYVFKNENNSVPERNCSRKNSVPKAILFRELPICSNMFSYSVCCMYLREYYHYTIIYWKLKATTYTSDFLWSVHSHQIRFVSKSDFKVTNLI